MNKHGTVPLTHSLARKEWTGSSSQSGSLAGYHVIPHHYNQVVESGGEWLPPPPPPPAHFICHQPLHPQLRPLSSHHSRTSSSRPVTPQPSGESTAILPCGGHCIVFERFCHRCLQVSFVGGILSGCILTGAGLLGSPEVGVLAYIGGLTALVCGLLLAIQSRSATRPRRRPHRHRGAAPAGQLATAPPAGLLPAVGALHGPGLPASATLRREEIPLRHLRPPPSPSQQLTDDFREESGIPWWRRETMD